MSLRFFNTLSHSLEEFRPVAAGKVGLYTCGPTVYDYSHIGNFRSYVFEDLVKRYLLFRGFHVFHVMNVTDIDDKTIRKAHELNVPLAEVGRTYLASFFEDIAQLNIERADVYPRATQHIAEMIALIERLLHKGLAYIKDHSVYFSIGRFADYGRLANIEKDNLRSGLRVDLDEYEKEEVQDFVLWKARKEGEPFWESPFGPGRPGWHIECSAMSMKYLGEQFDIHMGGVDNIFPHHENEIAQSQGATGKKFVSYWLHCQHLVVDNKKMSKSLGNFYTLRDLVQKGFDPMVIRYLLISTHYRKLLNFTLPGLEMAKQSLNRIKDFLFTLEQLNPPSGQTPAFTKEISECEAGFIQNMDDDFNISGALGVIFDFIHRNHLHLDRLQRGDVEKIRDFIRRLDAVLGVLKEKSGETLEAEILAKIRLREEARGRRDFQQADCIRLELKEMGIRLIDTPDGVKWKWAD